MSRWSRRSALPLVGAAALVALLTGAAAAPSPYSTPAPPVALPVLPSGEERDVAELKAHARSTAAAAQAAAERAAQAAAARAAAERAAAEQAAAAERAAADRAAAAERASRSARSADPRGIARSLLAARGQSGQFSCLDSLWTKESGWRWDADNPTSSAYGIPQALPGAKMASAGADWRTDPETQIRWGLEYISQSYGTPCAAWRHSQAVDWY